MSPSSERDRRRAQDVADVLLGFVADWQHRQNSGDIQEIDTFARSMVDDRLLAAAELLKEHSYTKFVEQLTAMYAGPDGRPQYQVSLTTANGPEIVGGIARALCAAYDLDWRTMRARRGLSSLESRQRSRTSVTQRLRQSDSNKQGKK